MANTKGRRRRFGAVRQLPSGRYQVRYRGPDGLMRPAERTFDTETDATVWLTVTEAEMVRGEWIDPDAGRIPLGDYAAEWIVQRPRLAPRTIALYESLLRLHIEPTLGRLHLTALTPARVRSWRAGLLDAGVGAVTVAKSYRLLRAVLTTAVDDELMRRNPCRVKGAGREKSAERTVVGIEDVYALADAIAPRWRALVLLAAFGGLRWGELAALRRQRDNDRVLERLGRLRAAATGSENLMLPLLECVEAYATVGEMCDVLRDVFGEYRSTSFM